MPTSGKKTTKLSDKDTYEEEEGEGGGLHQSPSPTCPVCLESSSSSSGMAVGACDHPVCAECCLRLRALCGRRECPVCRRDLPTVFVLSSPRPHAQVQRSLPPLPMDRRLGVCFESARLEARCRRLLLNRCGACGRDDFGSFALLEQHVRREHKLFFCDICTQDLKVCLSGPHYSIMDFFLRLNQYRLSEFNDGLLALSFFSHYSNTCPGIPNTISDMKTLEQPILRPHCELPLVWSPMVCHLVIPILVR